MCGINGVFAYGANAPPVDPQEVTRVRDAMAVRGPDGSGIWISGDRRVGLGHRRLAVIDLSPKGEQPMVSPLGNRITFNGEIYNYKALRADLEARGYDFKSDSDTEVLLHLFAEHGHDMVHLLRGMFAFALWDQRRNGLWLVRDPLGIKPLYYADDGSSIRFASQVKALKTGWLKDLGPDPAGHVGFFLWGSVPDPHTLYRSVQSVPAGTALWIDSQRHVTQTEYFNVSREFAVAESRVYGRSHAASSESLIREELRRSVGRHMVADVPVGVFLSSGLDSAAITAFASESSAMPLTTVTVGCQEFKGTELDETPLARGVAQAYGSSHSERWFSKTDFVAEIDSILGAMDQPSIDGVNTFLVCREAARAGLKVALSGLGGDEMLGGYPSFAELPKAQKFLKPLSRLPFLSGALRRAMSVVPESVLSPKYAGVLEFGSSIGDMYFLRRALFMPWELGQVMDADMAREGWNQLGLLSNLRRVSSGPTSTFLQISALELTQYMRNQLLRDTDWAGMANSLEVRVPFLDVDLLRVVAEVSASQIPSRTSILSAIHGPDLAHRLASRPKTGFAVPIRDWGREVLGPTVTKCRGLKGWAREIYARFA